MWVKCDGGLDCWTQVNTFKHNLSKRDVRKQHRANANGVQCISNFYAMRSCLFHKRHPCFTEYYHYNPQPTRHPPKFNRMHYMTVNVLIRIM